MDAMRNAWTDERLDDLNERVGELGRRMDAGFSQVHEDFQALRMETKSEINLLRSEVRKDLASLHHLMVQLTGGVIATIVATEIASRL